MLTGHQTGPRSWVGIRVRRDENYGTIISDFNSRFRTLSIRMDDGAEAEIILNNMGPNVNPEELAKWEWLWEKTGNKNWYKF